MLWNGSIWPHWHSCTAFKAAITTSSGVVVFFPMSSHFIPSENDSGDKRDAGETHQFSFRVLSIVITTLNCASNFPLSCIRNYTGTICTSPVKPAPGTHLGPISSRFVTQSRPFTLGQRWGERACDHWF